MVRRMLGLKRWSDQPNGQILKFAEGNGDVKRKIFANTESDRKMNDRIKKGIKENEK